MLQDIDKEELKTKLADLAVELTKGVEGPRLDTYLQLLGKWIHADNGFGESNEFLELCNSAKRMALKRVWGRERDLKSDILDYFNVTNCYADITTISRDLTIVTKQEKQRLRTLLWRLVNEDKILENAGRGKYRLIKDCSFVDWANASTDPIDLWLPFELSSPHFSILNPGDIVLFMGSPNSGKTAATLSIAKENRRKWDVYYFSTEISAASFNRRLKKFKDSDIKPNEIKFSDDFNDFADIIQPGHGKLNIIDYLEVYDNFYEIGNILNKIHKKLDGAVCVANIQKDPNKEFGLGGNFSQMKPVLSVSLDRENVATITKCKEFNNERIENPYRKVFYYKIVEGCKLIRRTPSVGWVRKNENGGQHGFA